VRWAIGKSVGYVKKRKEGALATASEAISTYLSSPHVQSLQPSTQEKYSRDLSIFTRWCAAHSMIQDDKTKRWYAVDCDEEHGPIMLHQINGQVVQIFLDYVKNTCKPRKKGATEISTYFLRCLVQSVGPH
jgi:hypothetical protein